jgi:hypothetical protein
LRTRQQTDQAQEEVADDFGAHEADDT